MRVVVLGGAAVVDTGIAGIGVGGVYNREYGEGIAGGAVVGGTVVGCTAVGVTVVGCTVVGVTVVGVTVIGCTVVGCTVVGGGVGVGAGQVVVAADTAGAWVSTHEIYSKTCHEFRVHR